MSKLEPSASNFVMESLYLVGAERNFALGKMAVVSSGMVIGSGLLAEDMGEFLDRERQERRKVISWDRM